jgi:hypothetical protein
MASAGALRRMAATKAAGAPAVRTSAAPCGQAHIVGKPVIQFSAACGVGYGFDAEVDSRECHRADIDEIERRCRDEGGDFGLRLQATQLGLNIRVEQPPRRRVTPRTGIGVRCDSKSMS